MSEYKILKVIGKGAFGDAYLGMNTKEKKQYVIKQVDINNKSKEEKQHIFNEVKLLQQFNHINIVSYRDSFIDKKGLLNIVMQYCEGGDMNQVVESMQGNKIPQDKIVYWLAQIALAIFYMHQKKILHRDLKSPNIFILKGNIRLGDFGISKVLDHVRDLAQTNIGTPYYMSPQQYNHKPYSYKSDIWAFGCILYEMCNQRRPFEANNIQALGMKVVRGNFPPVSECYSRQLRGLISDMLEKNPAKRPNIIEILLKPFIKKKLVEYMREMYLKKDQISKESLASMIQQAKKLSVVLEEKKPVKEVQTERERSTSAKKNRVEEEKEKEKKERERKKLQLQKQLSKHNKERQEMAEKLKKIEEERKMLLAKKNSEKNLKVIYEKVQQAGQEKVQQPKPQPQHHSKPQKKPTTQQSSKNLIGKVLSQVPTQPTSRTSHSGHTQKSHSTSVTSTKTQQAKKPQQPKQQKKPQQLAKSPEPIKPQASLVSEADDRRAFRMEEDYEMDFEDCQPETDENYEDEMFESQDQREFEVQNRVPTFASDENKLAKEVQEIKNLVMVSNQAVEQITKKQPPTIAQQVKPQPKKQPQTHKSPQTQQVTPQPQPIKTQQQIQQAAQSLKQQIKMKTQHINSIRNQLSNIDFQLSQSQQQRQEFGRVSLPPQNVNFKKKQFNPQHAKINDRINMLKGSAETILGTEMYQKFYQYLVTMKEKGRGVKRDYLEQILGKDKIGAYHLVEQIARLGKVLDKIPKWL